MCLTVAIGNDAKHNTQQPDVVRRRCLIPRTHRCWIQIQKSKLEGATWKPSHFKVYWCAHISTGAISTQVKLAATAKFKTRYFSLPQCQLSRRSTYTVSPCHDWTRLLAWFWLLSHFESYSWRHRTITSWTVTYGREFTSIRSFHRPNGGSFLRTERFTAPAFTAHLGGHITLRNAGISSKTRSFDHQHLQTTGSDYGMWRHRYTYLIATLETRRKSQAILHYSRLEG